jgi:hypothetical protein
LLLNTPACLPSPPHRWLLFGVPDANGYICNAVRDYLSSDEAQTSTFNVATCTSFWAAMNGKEHNFGDAKALFWDYLCVPQKSIHYERNRDNLLVAKVAKGRTDDEDKQFDDALRLMPNLYASPRVQVWRISHYPTEQPGEPGRGTFPFLAGSDYEVAVGRKMASKPTKDGKRPKGKEAKYEDAEPHWPEEREDGKRVFSYERSGWCVLVPPDELRLQHSEMRLQHSATLEPSCLSDTA